MSIPYIHPQFLYQTPYLVPFYQQPAISPFIPPAPLPPSPNAGSNARRVRFADEETRYPPTRPRPPSWHAGMAGSAPPPNQLPFPSPPYAYAPLPPMMPVAGPPPGYIPHRRRSDSAVPPMHPGWVTVPAWTMYHSPQYQAPPPSQFHPLLNAESAAEPLLYFDLSTHAFDPMRITSPRQTTGTPLSLDELAQQATHPGVTRMRIICDLIPQWDVVLEPQRDYVSSSGYLAIPHQQAASNQPITLGDVLVAVHRMLQTQITHRDWARLSNTEATNIARAYTRRCRTYPSAEQFEASQGVRRVDYLEDKYLFKGLLRLRGDDGFDTVKLLVDKR